MSFFMVLTFKQLLLSKIRFISKNNKGKRTKKISLLREIRVFSPRGCGQIQKVIRPHTKRP